MVAEVFGFAGNAGQGRRDCGKRWLVVWGGTLLVVLATLTPVRARASANNELVLDDAAVLQLEQQAISAQPREQCFLFSEVVHHLTEQAGRQIAAGQEEQAQATLKHADAVMAKMQVAVQQDAKRLKNAEMLMEHASRRLSDILHVASETSRASVQSTLQKLNALQTELLAQVFAK